MFAMEKIQEISGLEEQLHDFMMHFDAQTKIQGALRSENITNQVNSFLYPIL